MGKTYKDSLWGKPEKKKPKRRAHQKRDLVSKEEEKYKPWRKVV